jgi:hypothetical protein
MARNLTIEQAQLLRSPQLRVNVFATFFLDEGTYRFCDDTVDLTYDGDVYMGANGLSSATDIRSGGEYAAEPVTLILDGNRMAQYGIEDPARVLRDIMGYLTAQRRVDLDLAFRYPYERTPSLVIRGYAGKINAPRLIDGQMDMDSEEAEPASKLEITLDSLAMRYQRMTNRTRSHPDQLLIDPTDDFFSFTADAVNRDRTLPWGKRSV